MCGCRKRNGGVIEGLHAVICICRLAFDDVKSPPARVPQNHPTPHSGGIKCEGPPAELHCTVHTASLCIERRRLSTYFTGLADSRFKITTIQLVDVDISEIDLGRNATHYP